MITSRLALMPLEVRLQAGHTPYQYPDGEVARELEVKRSRFIALIGPAASRGEAMTFVERCQSRYPDARHVCWAFVAGNPAGGAEMGSNDAGEPAGTAGRPMLSVLEHKGLGDVVAVVIRYFGGIKLGAGGLVRAYSAAVQQALDGLPLAWREPMIERLLKFDFEFESLVRRLVPAYGGHLEAPDYAQQVTAALQIREVDWPALEDALREASRARIQAFDTQDNDGKDHGK
ncbi:putative YigZ family protein [Natronospira proteinivora]|uniref:YigZ family protein n=1 Tax=Natronospira proteinivora TaxID=1807133 RepID=A0ABT1G4K5_9GAMM|nr:YigZ family protein [Natronospira proteinivora]MCP1726231.1 putative YigZ family protein [Natronospira proteinivora]